MIIDIQVPSPGESITQVQLAAWLVSDGEIVSKDQELAEIDSDKATLSISAPEDGKVSILSLQGDTVKVGEIIARLDTSFKAERKSEPSVQNSPVVASDPAETVAPKKVITSANHKAAIEAKKNITMTPLARKVFENHQTGMNELREFLVGKRIGKKEAITIVQQMKQSTTAIINRNAERKKMSPLRLKLSERLVAVKNQTAMLTTFNEVNMSAVMALRKKYTAAFIEKYGFKLGFMGFFTMATAIALGEFPMINGQIEAEEIILHDYCDIGIAVSAPKGLVVPVIRNAESLSIPEIELKISELATKARNSKLSLEEMSGGTFTITNGGVFGSLMSTPIINPPQSAILGMHAIQDRPVAIDGQVMIQPMMYIALSYDHRIIDGKDSVSFLVKVKQLIENPADMLLNGNEPGSVLLDL